MRQNPSSFIQEFPDDILVDEKRRRSDRLWNIFTILLIVLMVGLCSVFFLIFTNPQSALNPAPPPTMPVLIVLPTSTATQRALPPTWTPTVIVLTPTLTSTTAPAGIFPRGQSSQLPRAIFPLRLLSFSGCTDGRRGWSFPWHQ